MDLNKLSEDFIQILGNYKQNVLEFLPNLFTAFFIFFFGYLVARLIRTIVIRSINKLHRIIPNQVMRQRIKNIIEEKQFTKLIGGILYWIIIIFFLLVASEALGMPVVTTWFGEIMSFLPRILSAILLLIAGVILSVFLRDFIATAASSARIGYSDILGKLAQVVILLVTILIATNQIGIDISIVENVIIIALGALLFGAAFAFALGAKTSISNILASYYLQKHYKVGDKVRIGDYEGRIVEISQQAVILDSAEGQVCVPSLEFSQKHLCIIVKGERIMSNEQQLVLEFVSAHPIDAAKTLDSLPLEESGQFLKELPSTVAAQLIQQFDPLTAAHCLNTLDAHIASAILAELSTEIAVTLIRRMDRQKRLDVLLNLPEKISESLEIYLQYPENTVGASMTLDVITIFDDQTTKEALKLLKRQPNYITFHIPVINREHNFVGLTDIRQIMLAKPGSFVSSVTQSGIGQLSPNSTLEAVLPHPDWRFYQYLPVVNEKGGLLGIIDFQTILRLRNGAQKKKQSGSGQDAGKALGELYWIGMSALFKGAVSVLKPDKNST